MDTKTLKNVELTIDSVSRQTLIYLMSLFVAYLYSVGMAESAPIDRGKELVSTQCFACHGIDGISLIDIYPNLRGQKENYLVKQLNDFKDGSRVDPIMGPMASMLTDEDIVVVSEYLSKLE